MEKEYNFFCYLNELQKTKRYASYDKVFWESVSEHTYKMIVMIDKLFDLLNLDLDYRKCIKLAIYHDFCEVDMKEDLDAYEVSKDKNMQKKKDEMEDKKMLEISKKYDCDDIYNIFKEFEDQITLESKFVKAVDRIETKIRCISIEEKELDHLDFTALYCDTSVRNFPQIIPFYKEVKKRMKERYETAGWPWKEEYDAIFKECEEE